MKVYLDMVGCRLNQAEIEQLALDLTARGQEVVADPAMADYVVINTCCVTTKACADSRKMIRHYQRETTAKVLVTGCWVSAFPEYAEKLADQGDVFPNPEKDTFLGRFSASVSTNDLETLETVKPELGHRSRTRSFIKVQEGCNNACTYCLTRLARGKSVSVPAEQVIERIHQAEALGAQEVVLTGVQLGSWGKDLEGNLRIADLVEAILSETSVPRIRISSIEPWDLNERLLGCFDDPRLCPHLHIPLQSGSDAILRRMARPINTQRYRDLIQSINLREPQVAITTDIIVGFPGETDALFEETMQFITDMNFSGGHVFRFSPMPHTPAAQYPEQVLAAVSQERSARVRSLLHEKTRLYQERKIGQVATVLWEQHKEDGSLISYTGLTPDYFRVRTQSYADLTNTITLTRITTMEPTGLLLGEII